MGVKDLEPLGATGLYYTLQADRDVVVVEAVAIGFKVNPHSSLASAVSPCPRQVITPLAII